MLSNLRCCQIVAGAVALASMACGCPVRAAESTAKFHIERGDYLIYTGSASASGSDTGMPDRSTTFDVKLSAFGMDKDLAGGLRLGEYWNVICPAGTNPYDTCVSRVRTSLSIMSFTDLDRVYPIDIDAPIPPKRELRLGEEWEGVFDTRDTYSSMRPRVIFRVAGEETVVGRKCLRIELTPKEPLPYLMKDRAMSRGMLPDKEYLTEFKARCWVAEDTGWVVKLEKSYIVRAEWEEPARRATTSAALTLTLAEAKQVSGAELDKLIDQANRLDYIQELVKMYGWPGARNETIDSEWADGLISEFRKKYPDSQFEPVLKELSASSDAQRRDDVTNAAWHKLATDMIDKPAPDFKGEYTDGKPFEMGSLKGKPAVLIFLWLAKDFPGYRAPDIKAFADKWRKKGVQVVFVTQNTCTKSQARSFMSKYEFKSPFVIPAVIPNTFYRGDPCFAYKLNGLVNVVLLDSRGVVKYYRGDVYPQEIEPGLKKLIGG